MKGKVYIVGAGPGDIGLLTVKGLRCLQKAEVVIYDFHLNAQILNYINHDAEFIYAGKRSGHHAMTQEEINEILIQKAKEGKIICRLKGGDPFVFGRGGEEAEALAKNGIEFEVVPGVSSSIAAPAYAGIPLTHRLHSSSFAVIPGYEDTTKDWVRTVIVGADGGIVFAMLKQPISAEFNDRMVFAIPSMDAVDQLWLQNNRRPFEKLVADMIREMSKLTPQGHVHAQELYSAVNIVRRIPPAPLFALLSSKPEFVHVGDLHFRLGDSE